MSGPAQVRSTEVIERLQLALAKVQERVQAALDGLDGEIRRAGDWVEHDRPAYWRRAVKEAEDAVHQTKLELERCRMFTLDGERPACREQEAAFKAAQTRFTYCREKIDVVKKWQRSFRHESVEYQGRVGQLRRAVEQDLPAARAVLAKILRRIEEYQLERPPEAFSAPASAEAAPEPTMARGESSAPAPIVAASDAPPERAKETEN